MCGIAGIFSKEQMPDAIIAKKMADAIKHRGPDGQTLFSGMNLAVAFNRLAIIDLSENGNHPQQQGQWKVWLNGCIYNWRELRSDLKEYQFKSNGDTEVIAALIDKHGMQKAVPMLNGMFVIVAHNETTGDTYIARDRYGIKPLYYTEKNGSILFASEIKALLEHTDVSVKVNRSALGQWMRFQNVLSDETLFDGIYKMEKGTVWHLNTKQATKYWQWKFEPKEMSAISAYETTHDLLHNAIERQSQSDTNVAAWCSGGIDSSIIAAEANVPLFTAGFTEPKFDERKYAEIISGKYWLQHYSALITRSTIYNYLKETIYHLEDLRVGPSYTNYALYELTGKFARVCLQGTGGDELFGGYTWRYKANNYNDIIDRSKMNLLNYGSNFSVTVQDDIYRRYEFDAENFLEGVLLVGDKLSMAHGIEDRLPFLDNDLVDFACTIPAELKADKRVLKGAYAHRLPEQITSRNKWGFTSPDSIWFFKNGFRYSEPYNLKQSKFMSEFVLPDAIDMAYKTKNTNAVWCLLAFNEWCEIFLGGKKPV